MSEIAAQRNPVVENRLRTIERTRENIRYRIKQIEKQLDDLTAQHVSDSQPWMSFERASSFEDWVAKNKERMGQSKSLREALQEDLTTLHANLDALKFDAERVARSGLRLGAQHASQAFARDFAALARDVRSNGIIDKRLLESLQRDSDAAIDRWRKTVEKDPSKQNIKGMLSQIRQSMLIGAAGPASEGALASLGEILGRSAQAASARFRAVPTVQNFKDYLSSIRTAQLLGATAEISGVPPELKRVRSCESYTVQRGDTLSSISKACYGVEYLWDQILFANLEAIGRNPDHLNPGTVLRIP